MKNNNTTTKNIKDIFATTKKEVSTLLPTNLGQKESIYRTSIFEGLSDKEKKAQRKKIRNFVHSIFSAIITETNKDKQTKLINSFIEFYKEVYKVNDYTFASIASENTKSENKDIIIKALNIISKTIKK